MVGFDEVDEMQSEEYRKAIQTFEKSGVVGEMLHDLARAAEKVQDWYTTRIGPDNALRFTGSFAVQVIDGDEAPTVDLWIKADTVNGYNWFNWDENIDRINFNPQLPV